ncbi:MAG: multicopper oxidase domain-containing protein [Verrucomicrobia bacterium]|nr:multicopper oxidase domain-containing protein [Verrucomicrobiota bacterium]
MLLALVLSGVFPAWAADQGPPEITGPSQLESRVPANRLQTLMSLAPRLAIPLSEQHDVIYDLDVTYTDSQLWNPAEGRPDKVKLRSYQGAGVAPGAPFVAPLIEVYPGQTVRVTLHNKLPDDPTCPTDGGSANIPHCFNGTNLHTHGLWINPNGNGDNMLISINPGVSFQYEYNIAPDHPAGTFWYHSHRHGSTALQVSSGMAGALIVRGTRAPVASANGDLDTLLRPIQDQPFRERVMVFQQIQYACRDKNGNIERNPDQSYACGPNESGGVEDYDQFGPGSWPASGRFTSINGAVLGHLDSAAAGQVERWRMIHGGVRDTIALQLRKRAPGAKEPAGLTAATAQAYVDANCTGAPIPYHLVAADGLTMAAAARTEVAVFQPGYRWDALVVFPEAGDYCILNETSTASSSVNQNFRPTQLLGTVHVSGGAPVNGDLSEYLKAQLQAAAAANMPQDVRGKVTHELADGMRLTSFIPHSDVTDSEVTGAQKLTFNIDVSQINEVFFEVDGQPYDPKRIDRTLILGGADEWTLKSNFVSHPFHIHVNPFQIVKIIAPDGKTDVSAPGAVDNFGKDQNGKPVIDPQYPGLKGVWKDTLFIKNVAAGGGPSGAYTVIVRTRYERYIGDFVLHCHILDHEDQGMMQNIRIALPDGHGGSAQGHH